MHDPFQIGGHIITLYGDDVFELQLLVNAQPRSVLRMVCRQSRVACITATEPGRLLQKQLAVRLVTGTAPHHGRAFAVEGRRVMGKAHVPSHIQGQQHRVAVVALDRAAFQQSGHIGNPIDVAEFFDKRTVQKPRVQTAQQVADIVAVFFQTDVARGVLLSGSGSGPRNWQ